MTHTDEPECCSTDLAPRPVRNRPGLPALAYRATTHPMSLQRMLARLPAQVVTDPASGAQLRPLKPLTTRSTEDFSVALLDAWAVTADVLTFYQERIANEGFLRTATERRSVLELARMIGYELGSGVAASAFLAFTVEDAPGSPGSAVVPAGTKVQSVPAQDQLPQTFETSAAITARAEYNALLPRRTRPQELAVYKPDTEGPQLLLLGLSAGFAPGTPGPRTIPSTEFSKVFPLDPTVVLPTGGNLIALEVQTIYLAGTSSGLKPGQPLLLVGKRGLDTAPLTKIVRRVEADPRHGHTRVELEDRPIRPIFTPRPRDLAVLTLQPLQLVQDQVETQVREQRWRERDLSAFLSIQGWSGQALASHINVFQPIRPVPPPAPFPGRRDVAGGVFGFQTRAGFFGNNAPAFDSLPAPRPEPNWDESGGWSVWRRHTRTISFYSDSTAFPPADVYLERTFAEVEAQSWALFKNPAETGFTPFWVRGVSERAVTGFSLSARATGLELDKADGTGLADTDKKNPPSFTVRATTAHVQSRRLELAGLPIEDALAAGDTSLELDRLVLNLQVGQTVILSGERADLRGVVTHQALTLSEILHNGGLTTLEFTQTPLKHPFMRNTVTLNANAAEATHGETVAEVVGSGDGSRPHQRFGLAKPPLTYVPAASAGGARSTLRLRVNGVLWQEAPALYGQDERSESYVVRREDDGKTQVQFGDGEMGARLPTGAENVTAVYCSGIGLAGMVAGGSLTLLQTRPLGIRGVTNPLPAAGAADPDSRDDARGNAPLTVLTLERIVSLRDYEDFARAFAGIAKAQAVALWDGETRLVHLTVAAAASPAAHPP